MPYINLDHLEMVLSALDIKYAEAKDEDIIAWLSEESIVEPTVSASGEIYTTKNNEIYIL
jgi:hypothetical protein